MAQIRLRNPFTGEADAVVSSTPPRDVEDIVKRAREAQSAWVDAGLEGRIAALRQLKDAIEQRGEALVEALAKDTGRVPLSRIEVAGVSQKIERDSRLARDCWNGFYDRRASAEEMLSWPTAHPYQVVCNISPWNFPVSLSFLDTIPALLAGCAVVVKPSEVTLRFVEVVEDALAACPALAGVLQFVRGDASAGAALVTACDYVCFTGSTPTGRIIARNAAERLIPFDLELGGKDAAIVLEDAPIEQTARSIVLGAMIASGQICTSIERVYVARRIEAQFLEALVAAARQMISNYEDSEGLIVPFIHAPQAKIFEDQIAQACDSGAQLVTGGVIEDRGGLWPTPTVLTKVDHDMDVMKEESFAPIIPLMPFDSDRNAVALANSGPYGLSGVVYGADMERAAKVAAQLRVGAASINLSRAHLRMRMFEQEGHGASGFGRSRVGPDGFLRFARRGAVAGGSFEAMRGVERPQAEGVFGS